MAKNATTANDGKTYLVEYFNLDAVISVGYRVNSERGTQFRIWANKVLKEYLVKGYAINEQRLKEQAKHKGGINCKFQHHGQISSKVLFCPNVLYSLRCNIIIFKSYDTF